MHQHKFTRLDASWNSDHDGQHDDAANVEFHIVSVFVLDTIFDVLCAVGLLTASLRAIHSTFVAQLQRELKNRGRDPASLIILLETWSQGFVAPVPVLLLVRHVIESRSHRVLELVLLQSGVIIISDPVVLRIDGAIAGLLSLLTVDLLEAADIRLVLHRWQLLASGQLA
jgi:hypothetical protein